MEESKGTPRQSPTVPQVLWQLDAYIIGVRVLFKMNEVGIRRGTVDSLGFIDHVAIAAARSCANQKIACQATTNAATTILCNRDLKIPDEVGCKETNL